MVFRICVWHLALCLYLATITVISKKVRQYESRLDVLKRLNENTVLVVNDWAMKFPPQLYHESQQDCFVKRRISWHISVVFRRVRGELQSQSFVHIIQQCNQDSTCIILIMQHVFKTLKAERPEITTAFYRQDNAGCYQCANTILACPVIGKSTGIQVSRLDFSDPQGGKGPADRLAATCKSHIRIYIYQRGTQCHQSRRDAGSTTLAWGSQWCSCGSFTDSARNKSRTEDPGNKQTAQFRVQRWGTCGLAGVQHWFMKTFCDGEKYRSV